MAKKLAPQKAKNKTNASKAASRKANRNAKKVQLPKGSRRRKTISEANAHLLVSSTSATMAPPEYICVKTLDRSKCLKYYRDNNTGNYTIPPYGELVERSECD